MSEEDVERVLSVIRRGRELMSDREVMDVAVGYELYERTGSKLALGWIGFAQALPLIFLALAGLVPCADCGMRHTSRWVSPRAS